MCYDGDWAALLFDILGGTNHAALFILNAKRGTLLLRWRRWRRSVLAGESCPGILPVLAVAEKDAGGCQEEQRRGYHQHDPEAGKDTDDLGPVPENGGPSVTQPALALSRVVVAKQKVLL